MHFFYCKYISYIVYCVHTHKLTDVDVGKWGIMMSVASYHTPKCRPCWNAQLSTRISSVTKSIYCVGYILLLKACSAWGDLLELWCSVRDFVSTVTRGGGIGSDPYQTLSYDVVCSDPLPWEQTDFCFTFGQRLVSDEISAWCDSYQTQRTVRWWRQSLSVLRRCLVEDRGCR